VFCVFDAFPYQLSLTRSDTAHRTTIGVAAVHLPAALGNLLHGEKPPWQIPVYHHTISLHRAVRQETLFDKLRRGDVLVVRWVDRLGRNYEDVCDTIREFMRRGVVIRTVINNFTFDGATKDPMQQAVRDALIGLMAATSQAQAEATKAAQRAGIEHAKQNDQRAYLGRKPSYTREQFVKVRALLGQQAVGIAQIAMETGLTRQAVYRIKDDPAGAEAALVGWGL
jgi:putative DNA-invertase from lambdoid prophage Rac